MLKEKISFERKKAVELVVDFSGRTEEYALAWLKLTNNAREYPDFIWRISNGRDNNVYVICNPKHVKEVTGFLTGIVCCYRQDTESSHYVGKILEKREIIVGIPHYEYSSSCSLDDEQWEKDMDNAVQEWLSVQEEFV